MSCCDKYWFDQYSSSLNRFFCQGLNEEVPIVLSSAVSDLGYFWMGGGHVHLKLGLSASEFATKVKNVKVMEASVPRTK